MQCDLSFHIYGTFACPCVAAQDWIVQAVAAATHCHVGWIVVWVSRPFDLNRISALALLACALQQLLIE